MNINRRKIELPIEVLSPLIEYFRDNTEVSMNTFYGKRYEEEEVEIEISYWINCSMIKFYSYLSLLKAYIQMVNPEMKITVETGYDMRIRYYGSIIRYFSEYSKIYMDMVKKVFPDVIIKNNKADED